MSRPRSLQDVIEELGFGQSQIWTGILVNGSWVADGAELLMITAIASSIGQDFNLSNVALGSLVSAVFVGTFGGALVSGLVGDRYGRRSAVLLSYPILIASCIGGAASQNYPQLLLFRCMAGFGMGVGQPSSFVMATEICPERYRSVNQACTFLAFTVGSMYSILAIWLDDPQMHHLHWRNLLLVSAVPPLIFWPLGWYFLDESPDFLAANGRTEEARDVLLRMQHQNGGPSETNLYFSAIPRQRDEALWTQLLRICSIHTAALCIIAFSFNFVLNGSFAAFPQIIPELFNNNYSAVSMLAYGSLFEIPCQLLGMVLGLNLTRKQALYVYFLGAGLSTALFALAQNENLEILGYLGVKGFPMIIAPSLLSLISESFPVEIRARGSAVAFGFGRIGSVLAPTLYGHTVDVTGNHRVFFLLCAALQPICCVLAACFLQETFGRQTLGEKSRLAQSPDMLSHGTMKQSSDQP